MSDWWRGLAVRERYLLLFGSVALVLALGYVLIWEPVIRQRAGLRQQVNDLKADYQWMQWAQGQFPVSSQASQAANAPPSAATSLLARIDRSLRESALKDIEKRIEPRGENQVNVDFAAVDFAALLQWLEILATHYRLHADSVTLERTKQPGVVRARLSLQIHQ